MSMFQGNVIQNGSVEIEFTTHDAAGGAIAPDTAFEIADIKVYKNGSATQRSSALGMVMTSPFDGIVGLHQVAIDLSENTDPGFWAPGGRYNVVLNPDTETVDGQTVIRVIGTFKIKSIAEMAALYPEGEIRYDAAAANANAFVGVDGIPSKKVSTVAAVESLLASTGLAKIKVNGTFTFDRNMENVIFDAEDNDALMQLQSTRSVSGCIFRNLEIQGPTPSSDFKVERCRVNGLNNVSGEIRECIFVDAFIQPENRLVIVDCHTDKTSGPTIINMTASIQLDVVISGHKGDLQITTMIDNIGHEIHIHMMGGLIELTSSCNFGNITIIGWGTLTNNSAGSVVDITGFQEIPQVSSTLTQQQVRDAMLLAATAGPGAAGSIDQAIVDPIPEPAQGIPPVAPTNLEFHQWLWSMWRNLSTETAAVQSIRNDAGVVLAKRPTQNDDGTTFTNSKFVSGP